MFFSILTQSNFRTFSSPLKEKPLKASSHFPSSPSFEHSWNKFLCQYVFNSLGYVPRRETAGSYGKSA